MDLTSLTTPRRAADGTFAIDVPDGWQQGRGAYGGLVLASLVRALEAAVGDRQRPLRSLTAEIPGATLPGPASIRVEILRAGSGVTTAAARLEQGGELRAHAVGVLGRDRATDARAPDPGSPPALPPWPDVPVFPTDDAVPTFAKHVELRLEGPSPFARGARPELEGFIRFREPGAGRDAAHLAALVDGFWPAAFALWSAPRPVGTVAFALTVTGDPARLDPTRPAAYRARTLAAHGGYMAELRELWTENGELLAINQQTIAIIV